MTAYLVAHELTVGACVCVLQALMKRFDANLDGAISYDEFCTRLRQLATAEAGAATGLQAILNRVAGASAFNTQDALVAAFREIDDNDSGLISHAELKTALRKWGVSLTDAETEVRATRCSGYGCSCADAC